MATQNFFALLDEENDDPQDIITRASVPAVAEKAAPLKKPAPKAAAKPTVVASAKEALKPEGAFDSRGARDGARGRGGRGYGSRGAYNGGERNNDRSFGPRDSTSEGGAPEGGEVRTYGENRPRGGGFGRGGGRGGRSRSSYNEGETRRGSGREFDRVSGTGRGSEMKRDGGGRGNWGVEGEVPSVEEVVIDDTPVKEKADEVIGDVVEKADGAEEGTATDAAVLSPEEEAKKAAEEAEEKEMTLDEYEKVLEEKRKGLTAAKGEARKVEADKDFETMQVHRKPVDNDDEFFIKLGGEKAARGKKAPEIVDDEEKKPKAININEFLKPADGTPYYPPRTTPRPGRFSEGGGRGGERREGRGGRGGGRGDAGRGSSGGAGRFNDARRSFAAAPSIEDQSQFPTLGDK